MGDKPIARWNSLKARPVRIGRSQRRHAGAALGPEPLECPLNFTCPPDGIDQVPELNTVQYMFEVYGVLGFSLSDSLEC